MKEIKKYVMIYFVMAGNETNGKSKKESRNDM